MFKGIGHVQLAAPKNSEQQCRAFFGDILGMTEIEKPENLKKTRWCLVRMWRASASYRYSRAIYPSLKSTSSIFNDRH